jgi:hypothetical protein
MMDSFANSDDTLLEMFHHDSVPSGGKTWLRSLKVAELTYNGDGTIQTIKGAQ